MATRASSDTGDPIQLRLALDEVRAKLQARVEMGEEFQTRVASANVNAAAAAQELATRFATGMDYNTSLLPKLFSGPILRE